MANLDMKDAEILAGQLATIGHPYGAVAILATAQDLVDWCRGGIFGGRPWTPAEQAGALVKEARLTLGNWEKAGGTTALRSLFGDMYPQCCESDPAWKPITFEEMIAKGLIRPPCETCDDRQLIGQAPEIRYCMACPGGRHLAKWEGERGLQRLNHPPIEKPRPTRDFSTVEPITPAQMAAALEDEQRRRAEQQPLLHRLGVD